jgi:hypothetical protein
MVIYLSLLICLAGLILYFLNNPPRNPASPRSATWAEAGRIMFFVGLLAFLLMYKSTTSFLR